MFSFFFLLFLAESDPLSVVECVESSEEISTKAFHSDDFVSGRGVAQFNNCLFIL